MKLDLGGGYGYRTLVPHGYTVVDVAQAHVVWDLNNTPLPFATNTVEVIHCSHTLEHLHKKQAVDLIRDCYRMLQPGGVLTLAVPDMDLFINGHLTGEWSWANEATMTITNLNQCIGGEFDRNDPWAHKYMWSWESLAYVLEKMGFTEIERHGHSDSKYAHLFPNAYNSDFACCTLYVDGVKANR